MDADSKGASSHHSLPQLLLKSFCTNQVNFQLEKELEYCLKWSMAVVLNRSSFEAHFQCQKKYSAHKTFNTNFECLKMFLTMLQVSKLGSRFFLLASHVFSTFFLTLVCLKEQFNCFLNYNEPASVRGHLNFARKTPASWHSLTS